MNNDLPGGGAYFIALFVFILVGMWLGHLIGISPQYLGGGEVVTIWNTIIKGDISLRSDKVIINDQVTITALRWSDIKSITLGTL